MPIKQKRKVLANSMIYFILRLYNIFQGRKKHLKKTFRYINNTLSDIQTLTFLGS